jgi:hypothetical protein
LIDERRRHKAFARPLARKAPVSRCGEARHPRQREFKAPYALLFTEFQQGAPPGGSARTIGKPFVIAKKFQ